MKQHTADYAANNPKKKGRKDMTRKKKSGPTETTETTEQAESDDGISIIATPESLAILDNLESAAGAADAADAAGAAGAAGAENTLRVVREVREITESLDIKERAELGARLADAIHELEEVEEEKKSEVAGYNEEIKRIDSVIHQIAREHRDGIRKLKVECSIEYNYVTGFVVVTRTDTGEVIEDREMKESERQIPLPLPSSSPSPTPATPEDPVKKSVEELAEEFTMTNAKTLDMEMSGVESGMELVYEGPLPGSTPEVDEEIVVMSDVVMSDGE